MDIYILEFLAEHCPRSRKARSLPNSEPVTCDDGVVCSPKYVRRPECVAYTGKVLIKVRKIKFK